MNLKAFKQAGHWPTLLSAFLYFDVSFMVWVMLGPLSLYTVIPHPLIPNWRIG